MDCLFCKIIAGEIPSKKIYEDEQVYAFYDIDPQAPVHFLVVPKEHISGPSAVTEQNASVVGDVYKRQILMFHYYILVPALCQ